MLLCAMNGNTQHKHSSEEWKKQFALVVVEKARGELLPIAQRPKRKRKGKMIKWLLSPHFPFAVSLDPFLSTSPQYLSKKCEWNCGSRRCFCPVAHFPLRTSFNGH
jgi:hypothetical protein